MKKYIFAKYTNQSLFEIDESIFIDWHIKYDILYAKKLNNNKLFKFMPIMSDLNNSDFIKYPDKIAVTIDFTDNDILEILEYNENNVKFLKTNKEICNLNFNRNTY
jgi:hypothetical protein